MRRENTRVVALPLFRTSWMVIALALVAYGAILAGSIIPTMTGAAVSSMATAVLGGALAMYTSMRTRAAPMRLGGRA
ncbi:MAG: protoheme IX farnesyltransferase, partial [Roseiflexus castenholzii]